MKSSIRSTFIGFQRCTKLSINIDSLRVHRSVRISLYAFCSQNCLHILSKVIGSTAKQPTHASSPLISRTFTQQLERKASQFNFTYWYNEDVFSINNPDFVWLRCIALNCFLLGFTLVDQEGTVPYCRFWSYYQIPGGFYLEHLQRARLANRGRLLLRTPGPVPFWTWICSNVETIFSWTCHVSGLWVSNIPRYFNVA